MHTWQIVLMFLVLVLLSGTAAAADWPMFGHDPQHTGVAGETVEPPLELLWKFKTNSSIRSSPAILDNTAYIGSDDGYVYALDAATGIEKWEYKVGGDIQSSAVSGDTLYIGAADRFGYVYALNVVTGTEKWKYEIGVALPYSPTVSGGTVYFGISWLGFGSVCALDVTTGEKKWEYKTSRDISSSPTISGDTVYIGSWDNYIYALDAPTGAEKWKYETDDMVVSSPAVSGNTIYIGSTDNYVYALDAVAGTEKWKYKTDGWIPLDSSPAISGGTVYVGSDDHYVYALDVLTGTEKWKYKTSGHVSSPVVAGGVVYVCSNDGYVYAFAPATATPAPTPTPSVTVLDCSPSPVHSGEDLDVHVSWANIPADWKLVVSLEKAEWDKTRLADDVSMPVSGSGSGTFALKVYPTTETYEYAKAWACFYKGPEWKSVYGNRGISVLPEPTTAPTIAPTTAPTTALTTASTATPVQTPKDTSPPAIRIDKPVTIEQNNNGLLEEGEKLKITYGATDPSGVTSIKILLDETLLESQNRAGTYTITTNSLSIGKHTIRVVATDSKSNRDSEELPITVERTGPSVYFGTTRTSINKGEDAIFTLSAVNPIGNPPMTVQLILKPPSGVSVTSSSFAKAGSGIYTCTQVIESGDNVRSIEVRITGSQIGTHEIASEVYYQFEGSPKSPTRYDTLTLVVEPEPPASTSKSGKPENRVPGFAAVVAGMILFAIYLRRKRA